MSPRLVVVGDALLDRDLDGEVARLAPDAPVPVVDQRSERVRAGGAGLAATLLARDGLDVTLVTALACDAPAAALRGALSELGVELVDVGLSGTTPEKVRVRTDGRSLLRLDRGGGGTVGAGGAVAQAAIAWADGVLVADYGRGVAAEPSIRAALRRAIDLRVPVVWDPHPRGPSPLPGVALATPSEPEARALAGGARARGVAGAAACASDLRRRWQAGWVAITRGRLGAIAVGPDDELIGAPTAAVAGADPCGAGDRFAARAVERLAAGAAAPRAVCDAVADASAYVAAGGVDGLERSRTPVAPHAADPADLAARVRARGGTIVATGGCFDLLHAGHVHTLQAARGLGDCLLVLVNSDASVRRLKGPTRPIVGEDDRASLLASLACVDAVAIFDGDTPVDELRRLRPHIWVKGGDYASVRLPEAAALEQWGGRVVTVPLLEGRSTTRLIEEAALHVV